VLLEATVPYSKQAMEHFLGKVVSRAVRAAGTCFARQHVNLHAAAADEVRVIGDGCRHG
jgi:hypothetical protein